MKRRDFVKLGSILSAGSLLPSTLYSGSPLESHVKPFTIGILGYGDRGSGLCQLMSSLPDMFEVKGICETIPFRLQKARETFGSKVLYHTDYLSLLDQKDIDVILIATPLYLHFDHAKAVLDAGKHLYLEKTMTFSVEQAIELNSLSKKYPNQVIQVGHQYRYSPLYFKVKELIQNGWLGKVTQIDARWDRNADWRRSVPSPELERQINWRMYREYSGGLTAELLSHQIDFINWAFETSPTEIVGTGGIDFFKDGRETYDNVQVMLRYGKEGMIGNFGATCANQYDGYAFKIKGNKGMVSLLTNDGVFYPEPDTRDALESVDGVSGATKLAWADDKKGLRILDEPIRDGSYYAITDFYRCLVNKELPHSNVSNGAKTAITVALANKSIYGEEKQFWKPEYNFG
ncbi:Gfo/Idh/MocA family oxidoreductase [Aquiflexum sp. TKW24L]|uniref:Gfo/Idh/MocA family protein n=1 Tax=Aquiflexum sp. TKW24L TaxID=2942212 RepID=UPI0020BF2870|nr:Gfo/Idh/MocA family oxidoreductase [Aquiflexum sp. TKW24L]MCL6257510.1 Gfo/Idh/MocA family oxidoreductase [Aquiflexum sp. TKW24L]